MPASQIQCPSTGLPANLLAHVFAYVALLNRVPDTNTGADYVHPFRKKKCDWTAVTRVCKAWRAAALAHPTLWATIDLKSGSAVSAQLMLKRAQTTPLMFRGEISKWSTAKLVLQHLHQTRTLDIRSTEVIMEKLVPRMGKVEAPHLLAIALDFIAGERYPRLPKNKKFLVNIAQNLHHIIFSSLYFPWDLSFSNLRTLSLSMPLYSESPEFLTENRDDPSLAVEKVLEGLKSMPLLECLSLREMVSPDYDENFHVPVHLPHLRALTLIDNGSSAAIMLRCLVVPQSAAISLICVSQWGHRTLVHRILDFLEDENGPKYTHMRINLTQKALLVHFSMDGYVGSNVKVRDGVITDNAHGPKLFFCMPGDDSTSNYVVSRLMAQIASVHPLVSLYIKGVLIWNVDVFSRILRNMNVLEHIKILLSSQTFVVTLFVALMRMPQTQQTPLMANDSQNDTQSAEPSSISAKTLCPKLRNLSFHKTKICPRLRNVDIGLPEGSEGTTSLADLFRRRIAHVKSEASENDNNRIKLKLDCCAVSEKNLTELREVDGLEVVWNEYNDGDPGWEDNFNEDWEHYSEESDDECDEYGGFDEDYETGEDRFESLSWTYRLEDAMASTRNTGSD